MIRRRFAILGVFMIATTSHAQATDKLTPEQKELYAMMIQLQGYVCDHVIRGFPIGMEARGLAARIYCAPGEIRYKVITNFKTKQTIIEHD